MSTLLVALTLLASVNQAPSSLTVLQWQEEQDVSQAAMRFRITIYESFRTDRDEYDQRRNAGDELLRTWRQSGRKSNQVAEVIAWFETAAEVSAAENSQSLPEVPAIGAMQRTVSTRGTAGTVPQADDAGLSLSIPQPSLAIDDTPKIETPGGYGVMNSMKRAIVNSLGSVSGTDKDPAPNEAAEDPPEVDLVNTIEPAAVTETDLAKRVGDYNSAIRLTDLMLNSAGPWTTERLEPLLVDLIELADLRRTMLAEATEENQATIDQLESPESAIATAGVRVKELRDASNAGEGENMEIRKAAMETLEAFWRELAEIAGEV